MVNLIKFNKIDRIRRLSILMPIRFCPSDPSILHTFANRTSQHIDNGVCKRVQFSHLKHGRFDTWRMLITI